MPLWRRYLAAVMAAKQLIAIKRDAVVAPVARWARADAQGSQKFPGTQKLSDYFYKRGPFSVALMCGGLSVDCVGRLCFYSDDKYLLISYRAHQLLY